MIRNHDIRLAPNNLFRLFLLILFAANSTFSEERVFPQKSWETKEPAAVGMKQKQVDEIAELLEGRGCVIRHGYVVKTWGDQAEKGDWLSSAKPLFSTLLFFAIQEGKIESVHTPISRFGWDLSEKDRAVTFHHLANMISGYARPDAPGSAWAYNDYAINLYRLTLFERVFQAKPEDVVNDPDRLGALQFEDGISFNNKARVFASVRDFSRLCWFWLNYGRWGDKQLLSEFFFFEYMSPQVPQDLPHTEEAETNDYLNIGSFGGGSDHFTRFGPGIYGYNFWFNDEGREHPEELTWTDAPDDAFMTIGAGGNSTVIIPSLDLVIVAARANWGTPKPGDPNSLMNRVMKLAIESTL